MLYIILFLLGLAVGSFVNVVIYRLPKSRTFIKGRSQCPNCSHEIPWHDLIPVISFLILRRRCRQCKAVISWAYPAIEIYSGLIFILSFWLLASPPTTFVSTVVGGSSGFLINWLFSVFLLEAFLILAVIDLKHLILPDSVMLAVLIVTLFFGISQLIFKQSRPLIFSVDNLIAAAVAFSLFFLVWFFSRGRWLGLGDAKLAGLMGLIFGSVGAGIILYGAIVAGALVGLILLVAKKANLKTKLPFGTFISFSASFYILFSPIIIEKTKDIFRFVIPIL